MWTSANRGRYDRSKLRYPSDLTDAEWALVRPLIPPAKRGGDKRTVDVREVVNGLFYVLSTGCQWRAIPKDLPPRSTVHGYFDLWTWDGTLDRIHFTLYQQCREQAGREVQPSAAIIDVPEFQYVVITGDIAGSVGRGDYTAFLVWGYRDDIWYLIAAHRDRLDLPGVVRFFQIVPSSSFTSGKITLSA